MKPLLWVTAKIQANEKLFKCVLDTKIVTEHYVCANQCNF